MRLIELLKEYWIEAKAILLAIVERAASYIDMDVHYNLTIHSSYKRSDKIKKKWRAASARYI